MGICNTDVYTTLGALGPLIGCDHEHERIIGLATPDQANALNNLLLGGLALYALNTVERLPLVRWMPLTGTLLSGSRLGLELLSIAPAVGVLALGSEAALHKKLAEFITWGKS